MSTCACTGAAQVVLLQVVQTQLELQFMQTFTRWLYTMPHSAMRGRRYACTDLQQQAEASGQAAACSSGAAAQAEAAQAADAVQVQQVLNRVMRDMHFRGAGCA